MWGDLHSLLPIVRGTARTSALLFATGVLGLALPKFSQRLRFAFPALCVSHLIHYSLVIPYIRVSKGTAFLSTPTFIVALIFGAIMYSLMIVLASAAVGPPESHSRRRRGIETAAVYLLGTVFTLAYIFRLHRATLLAVPLVFLELAALTMFARRRHFTSTASRAASVG